MLSRITIFVATLLCLAACQPQPENAVKAQSADWTSKPVSALTPMSESEVKALLSDVMVGPYCCDAASVYYRDGRFENYGYSLERGTWILQGNTACSRFGNPERKWCSDFYKDSDGNAYYSHMIGRDPIPVNPRPAPVETETLRQLSDVEVRALLTGAPLRQDDWDTEAIFYRDGRYAYYNGRRADHGHYVFRENRVCTKLDEFEREYCYFIYADEASRLYSAGREGGKGSPVSVHAATQEELRQRAVELTPRKK